MERFILGKIFGKKGNTFWGISFFSLLPEFPEISVQFVPTYKCQSPRGNASEKECKDLKDGGRFPKRLSLQCVSLLVGSVGGRFRTQLQTCRWKRIKVCGRRITQVKDKHKWASSVLPRELRWGKTMWMLQQPNRWSYRLLLQKIASRPIKRLERQKVPPPCFLLIPLASERSDQMIRLNLFRFLSGKKCSSICPEKKYRKFHSNGKRSSTGILLIVQKTFSIVLLGEFISRVCDRRLFLSRSRPVLLRSTSLHLL